MAPHRADRYLSLDLDFADVVNIALAADYDSHAIPTPDRRDLGAARPLGRHRAGLDRDARRSGAGR
jgi:hypothetical protein